MASCKGIQSGILHTLDIHAKSVNKLCRLCGNIALSQKEKDQNKDCPRPAAKQAQTIKCKFNIDISKDQTGNNPKHSKGLCAKCITLIRHVETRGISEKHKPLIESFLINDKSIWIDFDPSYGTESCPTCSHASKLSKGGRQKKVKHGLGADYSHHTDSFQPETSSLLDIDTSNLSIVGLTDIQRRHYECNICLNILSPKVVRTGCGHDFCSKCLSLVLRNNSNAHCPSGCRIKVDTSQVKSTKQADQKFYTQLLELQVQCKTCKYENTLESFNSDHNCLSRSHPNMVSILTSTDSVTKKSLPKQTMMSGLKTPKSVKPGPLENESPKTLEQSLNSDLSKPLSATEEKVFTHNFRRKYYQSAGGIVQAKTKGQPINVMKIAKPRKDSCIAASPLKKARARLQAKYRRFASGHSRASFRIQQATEIKTLSKKKKRELAKQAGLLPQHEMTARIGIMLKSYANLTGMQLKKVKRVLKRLGVNYASEAEEKAETESLLNNINIIGTKQNFEFKKESAKSVNGITVEPAVHIRIDNLPDFVIRKLEEYDKCNELVWKEGMPEDKIIVKIGGDRGGKGDHNTMKDCFQILNIESPNSVDNTQVYSMYYAPDSHSNMCIALQKFADDLKALHNYRWNQKTIYLILAGDCDYVYKLYALGGARGTYPCFVCLITQSIMQKSRKKRKKAAKRSLQNIKEQYAKFKANGCNIKKQAQFQNVIGMPLLDIEICDICIPYLHILLGIIKKHHDLLEKACTEIDMEIAIEKAAMQSMMSQTKFEEFVQRLREKFAIEIHIKTLKETIEEIEEDLSLAVLAQHHEEIEKLKAEISQNEAKLEKHQADTILEVGCGPVSESLDATLQNHNIKRQKFHGKSFVGNDCHKYLKPKVYEDVCDNVIVKTNSLTSNPAIREKAVSTSNKFKRLFELFVPIHKHISHSDYIPKDEIPIIQTEIDDYMNYYRQTFPDVNIILKHHLLEDHVTEWLERWQFGFGLFGEQGFESIHAKMNTIEDSKRGFSDDVKRGIAVLKSHLISTNSYILSEVPQIKRRRRKLHYC